MKIVLNREEMKAFKKLGDTLDSIEGIPVEKGLQDFKVSKKAYIVAMLKGEFTLELTPEMVTGFLEITNSFVVEVSPFIKALLGLFEAMSPACEKYNNKVASFFKEFEETPNTEDVWVIKNIETEEVAI